MFKDDITFAPDTARDENSWVLFPSDVEYRRQIFPPEVNQHAAKANVHLIHACINYVSKPGELLLDCFAGTGTLMIGALASRDVTLIEISPKFHELQKRALRRLEEIAPGVSDHVTLINAPLQLVLPLPGAADHIIFSPPYSNIMLSKGKDKMTQEMTSYDMAEYSQHPLNIGLMNDFIWSMEMEKTYRKCFETLKPRGTITVICKDHMEKQKSGERKRIQLSLSAWNACQTVGFRPYQWLKWKAPGSVYSSIYKSRGWEVVSDEDILILHKPQ